MDSSRVIWEHRMGQQQYETVKRMARFSTLCRLANVEIHLLRLNFTLCSGWVPVQALRLPPEVLLEDTRLLNPLVQLLVHFNH